MPFFSIIIPTFNSEKNIAECLNSIVEQSFNNYEIIFIDGLSADTTVDIIKEYSLKDPKIHWVSEKDLGIYDAMNKGIAKAKGEWLLFLGSDDYLAERTVLEDIDHIIKICKGYDVVYGNVKLQGDTTWGRDGQIYDGKFTREKLFSHNICHQSIFYRKQLFNTVGLYNIKYRLCADWDYNLKCWSKNEFLYVDMIISVFRAGGETTKTNEDITFEQDFSKNIKQYFEKSHNTYNYNLQSLLRKFSKKIFPKNT